MHFRDGKEYRADRGDTGGVGDLRRGAVHARAGGGTAGYRAL